MEDDSAPYQLVDDIFWNVPVVDWKLTKLQVEEVIFIFLPIGVVLYKFIEDETIRWGLIGLTAAVALLVLFARPNKRHFVRYCWVMLGFHLVTPMRWLRQATHRRIAYYTQRAPFRQRALTWINTILEGGPD